MKTSTLEALAPLLRVLRAHPALEEVRPATFYLHGREFVHFHEERGSVAADVLLAKGRVHMSATTQSDQAELLERIAQVLASLEARDRRRDRSSRNPRGSRKGGAP